MNVCMKFHGNPLNSCQDVSLNTTNVNLLVALEEKSVGRLGTMFCNVCNKLAIHPIVGEIVQSGPKW